MDALEIHDSVEALTAKAAYPSFPVGAASADGHGVSNRLNVSAASSFAVPSHWKGRYLKVKARRSAFVVSITTASKVLAFSQSSPPDNTSDLAGWPVEAYETLPDMLVPTDGTLFFNYAPESTGDLYFVVAEPDSVSLEGVA